MFFQGSLWTVLSTPGLTFLNPTCMNVRFFLRLIGGGGAKLVSLHELTTGGGVQIVNVPQCSLDQRYQLVMGKVGKHPSFPHFSFVMGRLPALAIAPHKLRPCRYVTMGLGLADEP